MLTALIGDEIINCYDGTHKKEQLKKWSKKKILLCPACGKPYEYCHGHIKDPYFRHMEKEECEDKYSESETEEHLAGKRDLYEWIKKQDGVTNTILEAWIPETKQRPDIMFEYNGKKYVIEYQCSPIASEYVERHELYKAAGICDIWICGTEKYLKENMRGKYLENNCLGYYSPSDKRFFFIEECYTTSLLNYISMNYNKNPLDIDFDNYRYDGIELYSCILDRCYFKKEVFIKNIKSYDYIKSKRKDRSKFARESKRNIREMILPILNKISNENYIYTFDYFDHIQCEIIYKNDSYINHINIKCDLFSETYYKINNFIKEDKKIYKDMSNIYFKIQKLSHSLKNKEITLLIDGHSKYSAIKSNIKYKNLLLNSGCSRWIPSDNYRVESSYPFLKELYNCILFLKNKNKNIVLGLPDCLPLIESYCGIYDLSNKDDLDYYLKTICGFNNIKYLEYI